MCCRPGAAPAQLAASRARDSARRDIGGWGRGRHGGAKAALVMVQLAWPRSLQPLPGARGRAVRFLLRPLVRVVPATRAGGGFCGIRSCLTACRRRVVALMVQFPPRATAWWLWVAPRAPRPCPPAAPRPRLAPRPPGPQAPPGPRATQAPGPPTQATPGPQAPRPPGAPPRPPGPQAPGPPTQATRPGPAWPPGPRAAHPGACGTRSTLLSVVFQAFARNSVRPLHLGALSRKWPLDVGVRHAQAPAIKCDA